MSAKRSEDLYRWWIWRRGRKRKHLQKENSKNLENVNNMTLA